MDRARVIETDSEGRPLSLTGTTKNITNRKSSDNQLQLIGAAFKSMSEGAVITDARGKYLFINQAFTKILGYQAKEVVGRQDALWSEENKERVGDRNTVMGRSIRAALKNDGCWQGELDWTAKGGRRKVPLSMNINTIYGADGGPSQYIAVFSDISFRREAEQSLLHMANHDTLTGLPNRSLFQDRLRTAIDRARRSGRLMAVLFMDLDRFKNINDSLGHGVGDLMLQEVARRLKDNLRDEDTVARLGGDEFTAIIEQIKDTKDILPVITKIQSAIGQDYDLVGHKVTISPSIGISVYPQDGEDADSLVKNADAAMYHAKRLGRNGHQFFTDELNHQVTARLDMESKIHNALRNDEFSVFYQPKIDVGSGAIAGCEALIRWFHPHDGNIPPDKFIAIAEDTGLIVPIGKWVLEQACEQAAQWLKEGVPNCSVAVNLSPRQFRQGNLVDIVSETLRQSGLPAACWN